MYKNLDHLSEEQIEDLMKRYYAGESVKKLISIFEFILLHILRTILRTTLVN